MHQYPIDPYVVACTLEEFYNGCTKRVMVRNPNVFGRLNNEQEMLEITIDVSPGWKQGTKFEYGNQLLVVLHEKPHALFKRVETDLIMTKKISLLEALHGTTFDLTTLDGRVITIDITDIVTPCYQKVVYGEGMPLHRDPSRRGNLIINFKVEFPRLTTEQKSEVRIILNDVVYD